MDYLEPFKTGKVDFAFNQIVIWDFKADRDQPLPSSKGSYEAGGETDGTIAWIALEAEAGSARLQFFRGVPSPSINERFHNGILLSLAVPSRKIVFQSIEDSEGNWAVILPVDWTTAPEMHLLVIERLNAEKPHCDPDLWIFFVERPDDFLWAKRPLRVAPQTSEWRPQKKSRKLSPLAAFLFWTWRKLRFK